MEYQLAELRALASIAENRKTDTGIPRVFMVKGHVPEHALATIYEPMINLILQGGKLMTIGARTLRYDPATYFVMSVDLPAIGAVSPGPAGEPYLAISLTLEPRIIGDLLGDLAPMAPTGASTGYCVCAVTPELLDAWLRMLRLIRAPHDIAALAPAYEREILYRVLQGPQGALLREIATPTTALARIHTTIRWIRDHFAEPLRIDALAEMAAMSPSAFHRHFKHVTALSPLQFQKNIRLLHARLRLINGGSSATSAAFEVGYESATQFSREYARLFGAPPAQDATRIIAAQRQAPHSGE